MDNLISRQQAVDVLKELTANGTNKGMISGEDAVHRIEMLPPAQPEPCEDTVSRKDCLKALSNMMDTDGFRNGWAVSRANVECMLKAVPSVTPKQRWIPVTERLPEEDDYRPCCGYEDGAVWWRNDMGLMGLGWYYPSTGKWAYYDESDRCEKCVENVVEWMQLPRREGDAE